jgi:hypothetical protein
VLAVGSPNSAELVASPLTHFQTNFSLLEPLPFKSSSALSEPRQLVSGVESLTHAPAAHWSGRVHGLPSSHGVPSATALPRHAPDWQVSLSVHGLPSSHGLPSLARFEQSGPKIETVAWYAPCPEKRRTLRYHVPGAGAVNWQYANWLAVASAQSNCVVVGGLPART